MFDIILAYNNNKGIGKDNKIPWVCKEDLAIFKKLTLNNIIIVGRKTFDSLPILPNRLIFCITSSIRKDTENVCFFPSLEFCLIEACNKYPEKKIFIAGGSQVYKTAFEKFGKDIDNIHCTKINNNVECDTFFDLEYYIKKNEHSWTMIKSIATKEYNYTMLSVNK